ncbi:hypothetical protein WCD74_13880 [Actinomycetospora sp. OC33-EN08]|uniref:Uncharacterized protein n=1 Tax=Actinomycetospora aurantiaca TaxID=3129233 RepID=A0ABU8MNY0_9PSEU
MSTNRSAPYPPDTTHGAQAARNRRAALRALWWSTGTALGAATIAAAFWFADREDPQIDSWTWTLLLIVLGLIVVAVLRATGAVRADRVAWSAALTDLLTERGQPSEEPADAVLGLSWNLERDVAQVAWNGIPAGTWRPTRNPSWQPRSTTDPVARDDVVHTSRHGYAHLRIEGRPYLVNRTGAVLVDADGIEWSLQKLSLPDGPRAIGMLPRILGPGGAVTVLQAHRRLEIEARSRSW